MGRVLYFEKDRQVVAPAGAAMAMTMDRDGLEPATVESIVDTIERGIEAERRQASEPDYRDNPFTVIVVRGKVAAEMERYGATVFGAPVVAAEDGDGGHADVLSCADSQSAREQLFWMSGMFAPDAPPQFVGAADGISDGTVRQWCLRQLQTLRWMIEDHERYLQEPPRTFDSADIAVGVEQHCRDIVRFASRYHATLRAFCSGDYDLVHRGTTHPSVER